MKSGGSLNLFFSTSVQVTLNDANAADSTVFQQSSSNQVR
jgi:hypothetical protein